MRSRIHINKNEKVLWKGRPAKKVCILESIFNPMLIFALIWALFDGFIFSAASETGGQAGLALNGFLLLHMMPVWIYLFGVITAGIRANNTRYVVTDRAVYFQKGIFTVTTERSPLNEVNHTGIHIGIIDNICGTGDVVMECIHDTHKIENIHGYEKVCDIIASVSEDQYTDTMFPNDMRPEENHGYRTKYSGRGNDSGI